MTRTKRIPVGSKSELYVVICHIFHADSLSCHDLVSAVFFRKILNVSCGINALMKRWWWRSSEIYVTFIELSRFSYNTFYQTDKYLLYWRGGGTRSHQAGRYLNQLTNSRQVIPAGRCARHQSTQDFTKLPCVFPGADPGPALTAARSFKLHYCILICMCL